MTLVLLIACIAVAAVFFLVGQNSEEKKRYEAEIKQKAQSFTEKIVTELDQVDTSDEGLAGVTNPVSPTEAPPEILTEAEKQVIADELARLEDQRKQQVLQTLSVAYSKALDQQKQEAFQMVDNLITQAKADWEALKKSGKASAAAKGTLASEYLAKSKVMEAQMDDSFEALIRKMEEQLNEEGIDPTAIIEQYRAEYKKIKEENRTAMMDKAIAAIKNK